MGLEIYPVLRHSETDVCTETGSAAAFYPVNPLAAALMAPTSVWVTIAAKLNYDLVKLNTKKA